MNSQWFGWKPSVVNRIGKQQNLRHDIVCYDYDNLYPQRLNLIHLQSPLLKQSVNVLADFLFGEGFETSETPVNEDGDTINDVLRFVAHDMANYQGFALLLDLNGLGQAQAIQPIPFEFVRFGLPDQFGRHIDVKVSNNWQEASFELPQGSALEPQTFPLWNPATLAENALEGQSVVMYFVGNHRHEYPLTSYDAISNTGESDTAIQRYELNSISSGFHGLTIFRAVGGWESEKEKQNLYNALEETIGVNGTGILAVDVDEDSGDILENIPPNNSDALFLNTIGHLQQSVTINYAMPPVLLGISAGGSVFNEQALVDGYVIYNTSTKTTRDMIADAFNKIGNFGEIIPRKILRDETMGVTEEETEEETTEEETPEEETEETTEETTTEEAA